MSSVVNPQDAVWTPPRALRGSSLQGAGPGVRVGWEVAITGAKPGTHLPERGGQGSRQTLKIAEGVVIKLV